MIELTPDPESLNSVLAALDALAQDGWISDTLKSQVAKLSQINRQQIELIRKLPYSPSYIGKLKPSGEVRAGGTGDRGYMVDTQSLITDLEKNWQIQGPTITNYSDLIYAGRQADLAGKKGVSVYGTDESYFDLIEAAIGDAAERIWDG